MIEAPPPVLRMAFDAEALAANWRTLDAMSTGKCGAAVKADGYGTGARRAVRTLLSAGCEAFFVAHWREAVEIADLVPPRALSVLHGPVIDEEVAYAQATGIVPVINSLAQARRWVEADGGPCHLMVDTGMSRLGIHVDDVGDPVVARLSVDVLMSHLARADEDDAMNAAQLARFRDVLPCVPHRSASLANSAGIALGPDYHFDLTRPGLALYGGIARPELAGRIAPVVAPEARILQVRRVRAGETIGYGATITAPRDMAIGTVALGYADGYLRAWSQKGGFRLGDTRVPVLGRVSMDMTAIDLSAAPNAREGDWVRAEYDLPRAAQITGLSQYELLTLSGPRLRDGIDVP